MRRIAILLALLFPGAAYAQFPGMELMRPISGSQVGTITTTNSTTITGAMYYGVVRMVCTVSCQINLNISGATVGATTASSTLLLPNEAVMMITPVGGKLTVIQSSGASSGKIYIQEMGR